MNKKSVIVSFLLCAALFMPQKNHPMDIVIMGLSALSSATMVIGTGYALNSISTSVTPKKASDFIKTPENIQSYSLTIRTKNNKHEIISEKQFQSKNSETLIADVLGFYRLQNKLQSTKLELLPTITVKNKQHKLKKIVLRKHSEKTLQEKITALFSVKKQLFTGNTKNIAVALGGLIVIPMICFQLITALLLGV